jgi:hypothetical protein
VERVQLHLIESGVTRVRAWGCGSPQSWRYRRITVGTLDDGRWFAHHTGHQGGAYVVGTEQAAQELADQWLSEGQGWTPTPAAFDSRGLPDDGGVWHRSGGSWFPGEAPTGGQA